LSPARRPVASWQIAVSGSPSAADTTSRPTGPEQSVPTWLTPCAPTWKISTVMPPAPRPQVDG